MYDKVNLIHDRNQYPVLGIFQVTEASISQQINQTLSSVLGRISIINVQTPSPIIGLYCMDNATEAKVYIVGAGISGLIAATELEALGYKPVILESDSAVGGRVQTDLIDGYQLDRGFQVLLEAYPKAIKYLDYDALELQSLDSGALLFENGTSKPFGDPLRDSRFLLPMTFSSDATLGDKWKSYQLNKRLQSTELTDIFQQEEVTTFEHLKRLGFSDLIINRFFRPFFSGIYLEPDLVTSNRMFEFVFKMFGAGRAMIPKGGIGAIANQLADKLNQTTIRLNCKVQRVTNDAIYLENGEQIITDFTIIASNPDKLLNNYATNLRWKRCDSLYFTVSGRTIKEPIIGLSTQYDSLVNNIFYPTSIETSSRGSDELLSVTVVKDHELDLDELVSKVQEELKEEFGISQATFLKHYSIDHALPELQNIQYQSGSGESLLTERIAIAGDHQLNASLNAAMASGETAAAMAHHSIANLLTLI